VRADLLDDVTVGFGADYPAFPRYPARYPSTIQQFPTYIPRYPTLSHTVWDNVGNLCRLRLDLADLELLQDVQQVGLPFAFFHCFVGKPDSGAANADIVPQVLL
jgi:hypothetical protein